MAADATERLYGRQPMARALASALMGQTAGAITVDGVEYSRSPAPANSTVELRVSLREAAAAAPGGQARCTTEDGEAGIATEVSVNPAWRSTVAEQTVCVPVRERAQGRQTATFELSTPSVGSGSENFPVNIVVGVRGNPENQAVVRSTLSVVGRTGTTVGAPMPPISHTSEKARAFATAVMGQDLSDSEIEGIVGDEPSLGFDWARSWSAGFCEFQGADPGSAQMEDCQRRMLRQLASSPLSALFGPVGNGGATALGAPIDRRQTEYRCGSCGGFAEKVGSLLRP